MTRRKKLSDGQVRNIRYARERLGYTIKELSAHFKTPYWTIVDIIYYRTRRGA